MQSEGGFPELDADVRSNYLFNSQIKGAIGADDDGTGAATLICQQTGRHMHLTSAGRQRALSCAPPCRQWVGHQLPAC